MSLAAAAAYETVSDDFAIDTLHVYFLAGPKPDRVLDMRVQRLNDSGRFATRAVRVEQGGTIVAHVTSSFVRVSAMGGPTMTHCVPRATSATIEKITLDDLEPGTNSQGPIMKFQRFPLFHTPRDPIEAAPSPDTMTYTCVAQISPAIQSNTRKIHALGVIMLSDYHILDAPPTVHNIPMGQPTINDYTRTRTENDFNLYTSLSHTIRFHVHEGFRADNLFYVEATVPWTSRRRAEVNSRMFSTRGDLIATCVQGSYYVMKTERDGAKL